MNVPGSLLINICLETLQTQKNSAEPTVLFHPKLPSTTSSEAPL